jgi:hypothetical protein
VGDCDNSEGRASSLGQECQPQVRHKHVRPHKWSNRKKADKLRANLRMDDNPTISSALKNVAAPYAFGTKGPYRDMMTGRLVMVRQLEDEEESLDYRGIQKLREANRRLRRELAESEFTRSRLEKAVPLQKSVESTGIKQIGYVVSGHPTEGNSKKKKVIPNEK